jgi:hypothetical protein
LVFLHVTGRGSHIDRGLLADVVIKATSLQEKANRRLREKSSPYRINEITITAGIPPDVAFTIGRIEVEEEASSLTSLSNAEIELEPGGVDMAADGSQPTLEDVDAASPAGAWSPPLSSPGGTALSG